MMKKETKLTKLFCNRFLITCVAILFAFGTVNAQVTTVSGVVKDISGETIIGASVTLKGTTAGTVTDVNGYYKLNVPATGKVLVISYIGMEIQEMPISGNTLNVTLKNTDKSLDEVVVVGYGSIKKRDLTGSVVSIKKEDLLLTPSANVMQAIQGKVAGMEILKSSGRAGAGVNITVRGTRSIYGDNTPLFIIDGIAGNYEALNPSDIESIEVLKDASSTAIYGSAGSNGVVIITTKAGKAGKLTVNFDAYLGYNGFSEYPHGLTGSAYTQLKKEAYRTQHGSYPEFMSSVFTNSEHLKAYEAGKWIDWVDLISRSGLTQNYSISVNGGNENTKTYLSLNYNDEQGLLKDDEMKKYVVRANIDHKLSAWAKAGVNMQITYNDLNQRSQNVFGNAMTFLPLGDAFDETGAINNIPIYGVTNPMSDEIPGQFVDNTLKTNLVGNGYLELTPIKGLSFKSVIGTSLSFSRQGKYFGSKSIANPEAGFSLPCALINNQSSYDYKWENILNYNFKIGDDHSIMLTGVTSWGKSSWEYAYAGGSGFDMDSYSFWNLDGATANKTIKSNYSQTQSMSYVARINYSFAGKYLATLSNRWDGVSRLSEGKKWDMFPAAAVAWRISDEEFFKEVNSVSNLKLRLGYGITGNSGGIGAYGTQSSGFNAASPVGFGDKTLGASYIINQAIGNSALTWEKSYNTNIGLDAGFLKGRINLTVDVYNTDTKSLLYYRSMPASLGGSWGSPFKIWQNIGETNNKGIEIMLNTRNFDKKNFKWSTQFTFTANKEKIVSLPGNTNLISDGLFLDQPIKTFYNYKYAGIWSEAEAAEAATYNSKPGDIKLATNGVLDATGKHAYSTNDRIILGSSVPDWTGGIQNNFIWKGFDASLFIMARWGQMIQNDIITRYDPTVGTGNSPEGFSYWTPENQTAYLPRPGLHDTSAGYIGFDALKFVDGSYVKIKNITIGYSLPKTLLDKVKMQKIRFYATAYDPFIFTKSDLLANQDPERGGSDNFPLTKEFVVGINVTF